ncbi:MAG: hypothetical protein AB3N14_12500 [Flavobacteriaceae bacterium]
MRVLSLLAGLLLFGSTYSQEKGVVLDSLPIPGSDDETYALYLPKNHDPNNLSAIVFIFDPAARGAVGVKPFVQAAEKYDYILVCSNNSKNGPYEPNMEVADRLFQHVLSKYAIARERIYTAGFSGGSRLASAIAVLAGSIQGVIGCGAGFSGNTAHIPTVGSSFSYVGLIGDRDMNYQEMQRAGLWLSSMKIENEILSYEDDHRWPPPEQLVRAIGWLELQAYKRGIKPRNNNTIENLFREEHKYALVLENEAKISGAVREYERTIRNFSAYYDLDSLETKIRTLKKSKAYKKESKAFQQVAKLEDTLTSKFSRKFYEEVELERSMDNFKWWRKQLTNLDERYVANESDYLQKMGKRLRFQLFALAIESFDRFVREKENKKAIYAAQLLDVQDPDNAFIHYRLAIGLAKLDLKQESLYHLEGALKNGWKSLDAIESMPAFNILRKEEKFAQLLEKYKG